MRVQPIPVSARGASGHVVDASTVHTLRAELSNLLDALTPEKASIDVLAVTRTLALLASVSLATCVAAIPAPAPVSVSAPAPAGASPPAVPVPSPRPGWLLLKTLLYQRHWQTYRTFCREYDKAAAMIDRVLVGTWPSRVQLHRWQAGTLKGLPYPDHCMVLEAMFPGHTAEQLFRRTPTTPARLQAVV